MSAIIQNLVGSAVLKLQNGSANEAEVLLKRVLAIEAKNLPALEILGLIKASQGAHYEAIQYLKSALQINPLNSSTHYNLAKSLMESGRDLEAIVHHKKVTALSPKNPDGWINYGKSLINIDKPTEAIEAFDKALNINPKNLMALLNKGGALKELSRFQEALDLAQLVIHLNSDLAEAWLNKGVALKNLGLFNDAIISYDKAIDLMPAYAEAWSNKGAVLGELFRFDEALKHYEKAIEIKPDYFEAWCNKGAALSELFRFDEALKHYDKAIEIKPDYAEAWTNKSFILLQSGNLKDGFELYEWRLKSKEMILHLKARNLTGPMWNGQDSLKEKTILLYSEQGLGDTIHFCRYASLISQLGGKVILQVQKPLVSLIKGISGVDQVISDQDKIALKTDYSIPLLSLPYLFKTNLSNIPHRSPYIFAKPEYLNKWSKKLGPKLKPRIGIAWSSTSGFKADQKRSLTFSEFRKCLPANHEDYDFICLQKVIKDQDKQLFEQYNYIRFFGDELNDFSDTAGIAGNLDLVISTCTSIPHLSGALGIPTWILLSYIPDWRWMLKDEASPWYSNTKLYRQKTIGAWEEVLLKIKSDLDLIKSPP